MSDSFIYIDGDNGLEEYFMMSYPADNHEVLVGEYFGQFRNYFYGRGRCGVRGSNTGLFIGHRWDKIGHLKSVQKAFKEQIAAGKERKISITPDFMVICDSVPEDFDYRGYHGIPKIVGEVYSPSTGTDDVTWKKDIYEAIGICEYWVIKDSENVELYTLVDGEYDVTRYSLDREKDILEIPCSIFDDLVIKIDKRIISGY
jgi:Uma2 family endonuclease